MEFMKSFLKNLYFFFIKQKILYYVKHPVGSVMWQKFQVLQRTTKLWRLEFQRTSSWNNSLFFGHSFLYLGISKRDNIKYVFSQRKSAKKKEKRIMVFCYQNCSSDQEKLLKFKAEGREFANFLRSLEQFCSGTCYVNQ